MQTVNYDIKQLLEGVKERLYVIPQFQRSFTWKSGQTKLLIDSIARNYPIGSLLILEKTDSIKFEIRDIEMYTDEPDRKEISIDDLASTNYVLDGQQRLTSIARVFLDAHPKQQCFFDIHKMWEDFDKDNPNWVILKNRTTKKIVAKNLIKSDAVLDQEKCDIAVSEYIEDYSNLFDDLDEKIRKKKLREASAKIKGIFEVIRKFTIPFVKLDSNASLESVCRIFETINSTGTRLTTFDLAVARYYPNPDLKNLLELSYEKYPALKDYGVDGEKILQVMSLFKLRNIDQKFPEATRSVLLSLDKSFIQEHWDQSVYIINNTLSWCSSIGIVHNYLSNLAFIVSASAALMCFPDKIISTPTLSNILKKWYYCTVLSSNTMPANNYKIGDDFRHFCRLLNEGLEPPYSKVFFTPKEIIAIRNKKSTKHYKAIQSILFNNMKKDLLTEQNFSSFNKFEDHHIFPYSLRNQGICKDKLNSIANRLYISEESNRDISSKCPKKYILSKIESHNNSGTSKSYDEILNQALIPISCINKESHSLLETNEFDNFLHERAKLIIEKIKSIVGHEWKSDSQISQ